tara:strand:- start:6400 stop:7206 length:807 start_codon:yes stop_codon:yes gene_type:complete
MAKNAVAVSAQSTALTVADEFEQFAGLGMDQVRTEDMTIPFLRILAQLSPQVNKRDGAYVDGAEAGMLYNTVSNEVFNGEEGVLVIPCYYNRRYVEWKPREKGGGYVGSYDSDDKIVHTTFRDDRGNDILPNGNLLSNTAQFFALLLDKDGLPQRCLITMTSSQLKRARKWVTQMQSRTAVGRNGMFVLPMMSQVYRLRTTEERNDKGSWFGWEISHARSLELPDEKSIFDLGVSFSAAVRAGDVKVKEESDANTGSSGRLADEDVPF